jgi:8-oxo-dGTP diphosphatase
VSGCSRPAEGDGDLPRVTVVGAAVVRFDVARGRRQVLGSRRTAPPQLAGYWEFAGGKVEPGESDEQALVRELREELGVEAVVGEQVGDDLEIGRTAVLRVYLAELVAGEPALIDHDEHRWLGADELLDVPWLPVDLPVVGELQRLLGEDVVRPPHPG